MVTNIQELSKDSLKNKKVLVRVDFNVPLDKQLQITDDTRIKAALPTIRYLLDNQAKVILASHLGRPKGKIVEELRMDPIARKLSELLNKEVSKLDTCSGDTVKAKIESMQAGDIVLLENIRFNPGEESNDTDFAKELASLAEIYVNDAFGTAHRAHASTAGVTSYLNQAVAGMLMDKELKMLGDKLDNPERPFTAIIGGSKISSKISVLKNLVKQVDTLIIGGGMAFTFLKAQGGQIGKSICEDDQLDTAREILNLADEFDTALILPEDTICTNVNIFENHGREDEIQSEIQDSKNISNDFEGLDIGPKSQEKFAQLISQSRTIVWNGPVGVFEYKCFEQGTRKVAEALAALNKQGGTTIIGGGDSVAALEKFKLKHEDFSHVSTGGGASLEFLEGKTLPGVACLDGYSTQSQKQGSEKSKTNKFSDELEKIQV